MTKSRIGLALSALGLAAILPAAPAEAARQGRPGATSSGSIIISASVAPTARVSGLEDFDFVSIDAVEGARTSRQICLLSNGRGLPIALSASGSGRDGAFELSNGSDTLGYAVEWSAPAQTEASAFGGAARARIGSAPSVAECRAGAGAASLTVALDARQFSAVKPERPATGILMLTVAPD